MSRSQPVGALALARAYHQAWQQGDYQAAWQLLDDDLTVEVPINSYPSKSAFTNAAQRTREMATDVRPITELGNEQEAVLIYDLTLPIGDLRVAEYFAVGGGRITRITHIHDTAALRAAAARH
jgi:ketosteroid isomerase-like protein